MGMDLVEKTLSTEVQFEGKIISARVDDVELPDGTRAKREVIGHNGGVGIVAVTDEKEIILVRQFRAGAKKVLLEIPAGKLEKGEDPLACGKRELIEETGYRAESFQKLTSFYGSPAILEEVIHVYLATGLQPGADSPDPGEFVQKLKIPLEQAREMAISGEFEDAKTIIGILLACAYLK